MGILKILTSAAEGLRTVATGAVEGAGTVAHGAAGAKKDPYPQKKSSNKPKK